MFTMVAESTRRTVSAVAAMAVVTFAGLTLEQGHLGALPAGTVEVGELTPVNLMQLASVTLPEIVVTGQRIAPVQLASDEVYELPEVVVVARRDVQFAAAAAPVEPAQG